MRIRKGKQRQNTKHISSSFNNDESGEENRIVGGTEKKLEDDINKEISKLNYFLEETDELIRNKDYDEIRNLHKRADKIIDNLADTIAQAEELKLIRVLLLGRLDNRQIWLTSEGASRDLNWVENVNKAPNITKRKSTYHTIVVRESATIAPLLARIFHGMDCQ